MASESVLTPVSSKPTLKGPGTNKAEIATLLYGVDSDRADTLAAHVENGMDLATIAGVIAAGGIGGFVTAPVINANQILNDTTYTELSNTRFTTKVTSGITVIEADLVFFAGAVGVDVGDIRVGTAAGAHISLSWLEYFDTSGDFQLDVVSNAFTHNPHSVIADVPSGFAKMRLVALVTSGADNDFWIEAKSNDDAAGTLQFKGGLIRAYECGQDTFADISTAP